MERRRQNRKHQRRRSQLTRLPPVQPEMQPRIAAQRSQRHHHHTGEPGQQLRSNSPATAAAAPKRTRRSASTNAASTTPKWFRACTSICRSAATQASPRSTAVINATFQFQCVNGNSQPAVVAPELRIPSLPLIACNFRVTRCMPAPTLRMLPLMQLRTTVRYAPSTGHYISHNSLSRAPFRHRHRRKFHVTLPTFRKFPKLRPHPCVHPCDGELRRSIFETISGSRARFLRALRRRFPRITAWLHRAFASRTRLLPLRPGPDLPSSAPRSRIGFRNCGKRLIRICRPTPPSARASLLCA